MNPKINGYKRGLASIVYKFFDKRTKGYGLNNKILVEELHKPIIKNFKRRKVYSNLKDNIWGVHLADMSLISICIGIKYLLCIIDLFSRYSWVIPLKIKKEIVLLKDLKKYWIIPIETQIKYR